MRDASAAALLLTNRIAPVAAKPFPAGQFWSLHERVGDLGALLGESASSIERTYALSPAESERIATLLDAAVGFTLERESLRSQGIEMIAPFDDRYPGRLRHRLAKAAPPLLYAAGRLNWLQDDGVAIVGARDVSDAGADVARAIAVHAARSGLSTISGAARGVDQLAMGAAIETEGRVVGVTTEGVRKVSRGAEMRRLLTDEQICIVSPYAPDVGFTPANAMARNKVIYALAGATVVVSSAKDSGGTWNGAVEALRSRYSQVLVWRGEGEGEGNAALVERGGTAITSVSEAADAVLGGEGSKEPDEQLSLLRGGSDVQAQAASPSVRPLRQLVDARLEEIRAIVMRHGGRSVAIFGSVARGDERPGSDIDFLVDLEPGTRPTELLSIGAELEEVLGTPVDVGTPATLRERLRADVMAEAITL